MYLKHTFNLPKKISAFSEKVLPGLCMHRMLSPLNSSTHPLFHISSLYLFRRLSLILSSYFLLYGSLFSIYLVKQNIHQCSFLAPEKKYENRIQSAFIFRHSGDIDLDSGFSARLPVLLSELYQGIFFHYAYARSPLLYSYLVYSLWLYPRLDNPRN